ncbi:hypothetical protein [Zoogloea dura]|uniref:Uncharacterized protein n=1 Tax=Zoogloea dura TaxID=2728840 RepID=A0A848GCV2_9RHOO|nr:hypothetical protein [Zoogloea dura]NML28952.1 hypothetical protein [Zoogloea dura]
MSPIAIALQTLAVAVAIQFFVRKDLGLVLAFFVPGALFVVEFLWFSFGASYQGGGASMLFPALLLWAIPVSMLGMACGSFFWWVSNRFRQK